MRKCPSCGKVIPLDVVFCGYCGTKISEKRCNRSILIKVPGGLNEHYRTLAENYIND